MGWGTTYVRNLSKAGAKLIIHKYHHKGWKDTYLGNYWESMEPGMTFNVTDKIRLVMQQSNGRFMFVKDDNEE